jgi:LPS export ABC transporter protein LptC
MIKDWQSPAYPLLGLILLGVLLSACSTPEPPKPVATPVTEGMGLRELTLRRTDNQGRPLWQIQAKTANYKNNQGKVQSLVGQLYADGKPIFRLQSPTAEIRQQGEQLLILGNTTVTDLRGKGVLTAEEFLWQPDTGTLIARKKPKLVYPLVQVTATEMRAQSRPQDVIALGNVQADSSLGLRLRAERLQWQVPQQRLVAGRNLAPSGTERPGAENPDPRALTLVRLQQLKGDGKGNQAVGEILTYDLKSQILQLQSQQSAVQIQLVQPQLAITGQAFTWQIPQRILLTDRPLTVRSAKSAVTVTANRGQLDLAREQVVLTGAVRATGQQQQSALTTDQLTWMLPTQQIEAVGNVRYQQQQPRFTVRGNRAIGLINEQQVSVSGGSDGGGVVTEIQM